MTAREDPWIGQPTKIDAARLDATVHLSAADHELISISRDFVPVDGSPRRRPRPHVREERRGCFSLVVLLALGALFAQDLFDGLMYPTIAMWANSDNVAIKSTLAGSIRHHRPSRGSRTARMAGPSARYWGLQRGIARIGGQASGTIASSAGICGCGVPVTLPVTHGRLMC
jgi:hypothetical protein